MFKRKLSLKKIGLWGVVVLFFVYSFIELSPSSLLRTNPVYISISSIAVTALALLFICLYRWIFSLIGAGLLTLCAWCRMLPNARNIYMLLLLAFSVFSLVVGIRYLKSSANNHAVNTESATCLLSSGFWGILLFLLETLKLSTFSAGIFHWGFTIIAAILSLFTVLVLLYFIFKHPKNRIRGIKDILKNVLLFVFSFLILMLLVYQLLKLSNYVFDFHEPQTVTARVVEVSHNNGGYRSFSYEEMTVLIDGEEYKIVINVHDAEEFSAGDTVTLDVSKGLLGVEYFHCDTDIQPL